MLRDKYEGPIETGMVFTAPDNDGVFGFRRDKVIARYDDTTLIMEALPCRMRKRLGSGVGELFRLPDVNLRIVMQPEVTCPRCGGETGESDLTYSGCHECRAEQESGDDGDG